jgi:hypothetical protein
VLQDIGLYNQQQGDIVGAAGGYMAAASSFVGAGVLATKGFSRRGLARNSMAGIGYAGRALEDTRRMSPRRAASTGRSLSRGLPRSNGGSVSRLPLPPPTASGALINPAAGSAVTQARGVTPEGIAAYESRIRSRQSPNPFSGFF